MSATTTSYPAISATSGGQHAQALRLGELRLLRAAVGATTVPGADAPQHGLAVGGELHERVLGRRRDEEGAGRR